VSIMFSAARSFTEPPGFNHSAFPEISTCGKPVVRLSNLSRGVFPTRCTGLVPTTEATDRESTVRLSGRSSPCEHRPALNLPGSGRFLLGCQLTLGILRQSKAQLKLCRPGSP